MPDINICTIDGWHYVAINGRPERVGWSTIEAARRRFRQVLDGWI